MNPHNKTNTSTPALDTFNSGSGVLQLEEDSGSDIDSSDAEELFVEAEVEYNSDDYDNCCF